MDIDILSLPSPLEVNLTFGKYKSDNLKLSRRCPSWAEEAFKAYVAYTSQTQKRDIHHYKASAFFTRLALFADQSNCHCFAELSVEIVNDFIVNVSYGSHKHQIHQLAELRKLILWLVALELIPASIFKEVYLSGKMALWFNEIMSRFGVMTAINDLMDFDEKSLNRLEVPVWAVEAINQYAIHCDRRLSKIFCSPLQCVIKAAACIRCMVRHYKILSFYEIKPSYLAELGLCLRPLQKYYDFFSHFIAFLAKQGFITEYMPEAFLRVKQSMFLFPEQNDWSDFPSGKVGPEELFQLQGQVNRLLKELGYSKKSQNQIMSGVSRHCLFLQEHGLTFSFEGALKWCHKLSPDTSGKYKTGLYLCHKLLCQEPILPDIMLEERYCQLRCKPKKFPSWSENWCQRYLKQRRQDGISESTVRQDITSLHYFTDYLNQRRVNSFNSLTIELLHDFDRDCNPGAARYKADVNRIIRSFLLFLAENGVVRYNLILTLPSYSVSKIRPVKTLTDVQLQELYRFCSDVSGECQTRDALAFKLALNLGLRAVDIVNLRFKSIDVKKKILRFRQRKTGRIVELPLPQTVLNALYEYLSTKRKEHNNDQVMLRSIAPHCRLKSAETFRSRVKALNCDHFTLHQLRKTFASLLLKAGVNFQLIADALGHANSQTLHVYLSTEPEQLRSCCFPFTGFELNSEEVII